MFALVSDKEIIKTAFIRTYQFLATSFKASNNKQIKDDGILYSFSDKLPEITLLNVTSVVYDSEGLLLKM
jgi:hypothetical protein